MIRFLISLPFLVLAIYSVYSGIKYTRMITNIFLGLKYRPQYEVIPSCQGEKIMILDSGGHEIEALLVEKKGADKVLIFCHDSGSTKESWEKYAYFFPDLGFHVLSVDFLGPKDLPENSSANTLSQWPSEEDVRKMQMVIHWAKNAFKPEAKIVLFGVSRGADIAYAAASREPMVKGVITDGLFSMKEIFRDYIRKWAPILVRPNLFGENYPSWVVNTFTNLGFWYCQRKSQKRFVNVEKLLKEKKSPLLLIHGELDDYISASHQQFLRRLIAAGTDDGSLTIPKAGHNEAVALDREAYENKIIEFLRKILA